MQRLPDCEHGTSPRRCPHCRRAHLNTIQRRRRAGLATPRRHCDHGSKTMRACPMCRQNDRMERRLASRIARGLATTGEQFTCRHGVAIMIGARYATKCKPCQQERSRAAYEKKLREANKQPQRPPHPHGNPGTPRKRDAEVRPWGRDLCGACQHPRKNHDGGRECYHVDAAGAYDCECVSYVDAAATAKATEAA